MSTKNGIKHCSFSSKLVSPLNTGANICLNGIYGSKSTKKKNATRSIMYPACDRNSIL